MPNGRRGRRSHACPAGQAPSLPIPSSATSAGTTRHVRSRDGSTGSTRWPAGCVRGVPRPCSSILPTTSTRSSWHADSTMMCEPGCPRSSRSQSRSPPDRRLSSEPGPGTAPAFDPSPADRTGHTVRSICGPASLVHLAGDRPGVRHRTQVPELVGVDHRAYRLNLPVEYVERQGVEDLAVPVAEDRARLAVHLAGLHRHVDPDEPGEDRGKHPGDIVGSDDRPGQLRGLAAAVRDDLNVSGEQPLRIAAGLPGPGTAACLMPGTLPGI